MDSRLTPGWLLQNPNEWIIANSFKVETDKRIGGGSFGEIYQGKILKTGETIALKFEKAHTQQPQLYYESRLYRILAGGTGIPRIHWFGVEGDYNIMVMDLLDASLEMLFQRCDRRFSLKTTLLLGIQMISRIEFLHSKGFIHHDIKPDNFLMGRGKNRGTVFMIDYGLAKRYRDVRTHQHIPYRETKGITGTIRFVSINAHVGIEQSRRDDLESVGYLLIYFLKGELPWQGVRAHGRREKYNKIGEIKISIRPEDLCKGLPHEFVDYITYVRGLKFDSTPDYRYLQNLFRTVLSREGFDSDQVFDWTERLLDDEKRNKQILHNETVPSSPWRRFHPAHMKEEKRDTRPNSVQKGLRENELCQFRDMMGEKGDGNRARTLDMGQRRRRRSQRFLTLQHQLQIPPFKGTRRTESEQKTQRCRLSLPPQLPTKEVEQTESELPLSTARKIRMSHAHLKAHRSRQDKLEQARHVLSRSLRQQLEIPSFNGNKSERSDNNDSSSSFLLRNPLSVITTRRTKYDAGNGQSPPKDPIIDLLNNPISYLPP
ncbi:putative Casein kinase 1 [Blattamonas nauphoetae]|uniref:non-specific serine/threonine protein kinase n=1 Tax=Blattamonas nauphoetae TaxID=2049346 RepID=A0ABQ9YHC3_9EUKA|nr:putative Casein kinase 1 [Blattamonas nauphoetae]